MSAPLPEPRRVPPLEADPAGVHHFAADLLAASAQLDDLGGFVCAGARADGWEGAGAAAYAATTGPLGRTADAMSLALRAVSRRLDRHGDELARLLDRRTGLLEQRGHLLDRASTLTAAAASVPPGADAVLVGLLEERADHAAAVRGFDDEVGRWLSDVADEEAAACDVLARVLTEDQVIAHYADRPDPADAALATAPAPGADPEDVHAWWVSLDHAEQLALIAAAPGAIGNRGGVPAWARDAANTVALDRDLAAWGSREADGTLCGDEARRLETARATREARREIGRGLDPVTGEPLTSQLYAYDPDAFGGDGAVALAAGDLGSADDVAVLVPGLGTDARSIAGLAVRAIDLAVAARVVDPRRRTAPMVWIGYDAPDNMPWSGGADGTGVVAESMATRGGARLSRAVTGLRAAEGPGAAGRAHLTVVGHSYGSTTTGHAAHDRGLAADDVVVVGSPGLGGDVERASDLHVPRGHVWVGANSSDLVARLGDEGHADLGVVGGGLGRNPAEDAFGARRFEAESTTRGLVPGIADHVKYFDPGTESLYDIAAVVTGHGDRVLPAAPVHDPWLGLPADPERGRTPVAVDTTTLRGTR